MSASISTTSETLVVSIETDRGKLHSQADCWLLDVKGVLLQCHTARLIGNCTHWILCQTSLLQYIYTWLVWQSKVHKCIEAGAYYNKPNTVYVFGCDMNRLQKQRMSH